MKIRKLHTIVGTVLGLAAAITLVTTSAQTYPVVDNPGSSSAGFVEPSHGLPSDELAFRQAGTNGLADDGRQEQGTLAVAVVGSARLGVTLREYDERGPAGSAPYRYQVWDNAETH